MPRVLSLFLSAGIASIARASISVVDTSLHLRGGVDTNPLALQSAEADGVSATDVTTGTASVRVAFASTAAASTTSTKKLSVATDATWFVGLPTENHLVHRLSGIWRTDAANWRISFEGAFVYIDGDRETLASLPCNANGLPLWRDRRAQNQQRGKLLLERGSGPTKLLLHVAALSNDYHTEAVARRVAFADRHDLQAGADLAWDRTSGSRWFSGVRFGRQWQDATPLPGGNFEYSNRYARPIAGWEVHRGEGAVWSFAAGPDFRHFDGSINRLLSGDRSRTSLWFESAFSAPLRHDFSITAKAAQWSWLASTGKSAYADLSLETSLTWKINPALSGRAAMKLHRCNYFPVVRDDWESIASVGATRQVTSAFSLSLDALWHRGWTALSQFSDRDFSRALVTLGASWKL